MTKRTFCSECRNHYTSRVCPCKSKPKPHINQMPDEDPIPVVFAPGFTDVMIVKDHTGRPICLVGSQTVLEDGAASLLDRVAELEACVNREIEAG